MYKINFKKNPPVDFSVGGTILMGGAFLIIAGITYLVGNEGSNNAGKILILTPFLTVGMYFILKCKYNSMLKRFKELDSSSDDNSGFYFMDDYLLIIGALQADVKKTFKVQILTETYAVNFFNQTIKFEDLREIELSKDGNILIFDTTDYRLSVNLDKYTSSPMFLAEKLVRSAAKVGNKLTVRDKIHRKNFTALDIDNNINSFMKENSFEEASETVYTDDEASLLLEKIYRDINEKIKQKEELDKERAKMAGF